MKNKVRVAAGKKSKRKGSRVERALVKMLKANGAQSARRTAQYNGKGDDSLADVVAPKELPHFHIECKGTAKRGLSKQEISDWFNQVYDDCPENKIPVIFHKANNEFWVVLVTDNVSAILDLPSNGFTTNETTIVPSLCNLIKDDDGRPYDRLRFSLPDLTFAFAYRGILVLNRMLAYEDNLRNTVDRGRGNNTLIPSCEGPSSCD